MPYANPRILSQGADIGPTITTLCACTLADYAAAGTVAPAVGDMVTFSATGDWYVAIVPDNQVARIGRVVKIEKAPAGTALGYVVVEWLDVVGFRWVTISNLANATRGNSAIKNGNTATVDDFDALATTGNLYVVAKSGTAGAGTLTCALVVG